MKHELTYVDFVLKNPISGDIKDKLRCYYNKNIEIYIGDFFLYSEIHRVLLERFGKAVQYVRLRQITKTIWDKSLILGFVLYYVLVKYFVSCDSVTSVSGGHGDNPNQTEYPEILLLQPLVSEKARSVVENWDIEQTLKVKKVTDSALVLDFLLRSHGIQILEHVSKNGYCYKDMVDMLGELEAQMLLFHVALHCF